MAFFSIIKNFKKSKKHVFLIKKDSVGKFFFAPKKRTIYGQSLHIVLKMLEYVHRTDYGQFNNKGVLSTLFRSLDHLKKTHQLWVSYA